MKNRHILALLLTLLGTNFALAQSTDDFVTTWKTDNPGASNSTSITIPTASGFTYNYKVAWDNDGAFGQTGIAGV